MLLSPTAELERFLISANVLGPWVEGSVRPVITDSLEGLPRPEESGISTAESTVSITDWETRPGDRFTNHIDHRVIDIDIREADAAGTVSCREIFEEIIRALNLHSGQLYTPRQVGQLEVSDIRIHGGPSQSWKYPEQGRAMSMRLGMYIRRDAYTQPLPI